KAAIKRFLARLFSSCTLCLCVFVVSSVCPLDAAGQTLYRRCAMNFNELIAIDAELHLHGETTGSPADEAARKYFGHTGAEPKLQELAAYYRSMKIGCVVF